MGRGLYRKRLWKTWLTVSCHSTIHCKISHLYYLSLLKTDNIPDIQELTLYSPTAPTIMIVTNFMYMISGYIPLSL